MGLATEKTIKIFVNNFGDSVESIGYLITDAVTATLPGHNNIKIMAGNIPKTGPHIMIEHELDKNKPSSATFIMENLILHEQFKMAKFTVSVSRTGIAPGMYKDVCHNHPESNVMRPMCVPILEPKPRLHRHRPRRSLFLV